MLNGDFVVSVYKREVKVRGAVLEYSGSDNAVERINCTESIDEDIFLMVLNSFSLFIPNPHFLFFLSSKTLHVYSTLSLFDLKKQEQGDIVIGSVCVCLSVCLSVSVHHAVSS